MRDADGSATVTAAESKAHAAFQASLQHASASEIEVVATEIDKLTNALDQQVAVLSAQRVDVEGHIARMNLGQGTEAARVAHHGLRAHGVVIDTMSDVRADLERFKQAVVEARDFLQGSDESAAQDARRTLAATERIDAGESAYEQAQVEHVDGAPGTATSPSVADAGPPAVAPDPGA